MSYNEFTNSRVKLEQFHIEAAQGRLVRGVQRRRLSDWLRWMADVIDGS
jgi:hypothetical protein